MTALEQLNAYLRRLELRLRLVAASRGAAIVAGSALLLTFAAVWLADRFEFARFIILPVRIFLFGLTATALSLALLIPVLRINRRWVTRFAEHRVQGFEQRLVTIGEQRDSRNPFLELLAEDALRIAGDYNSNVFAPAISFRAFVAVAFISMATLIWMIAAGPGYWGYGASLLWTGTAHAGSLPVYEIAVQPGNKTVRRNSDQTIKAQCIGFSAEKATLHARYRGTLKWEEAAMQPQRHGNAYEFLFVGLSESVDYFVEAGTRESKHYTLSVKDLPSVKRVRVTVHFPTELHLQDVVNDPGGDVRAVVGSEAEISVLTDRPLDRGVLVLDNGHNIDLLHGDGNWLSARLQVQKDGSYHIAAIDAGDAVRLSDDYFIEAKRDEPPSVRIVRPGRDPHVSPIEEVPVVVQAADDFGIEKLELHYSVNGSQEQTVSLLNAKGAKQAEGKTTLFLEDFKLAPGDLVSFYAVAHDAHSRSRTPIFFAQAEPFDYKFRQLQQMSSNGSMGGDDDRISERQKQLIAATWNEIKDGPQDRNKAAGDARFLSQVESKLSEEAKTLSERMGNRELVGTNPEFERFSMAMKQASNDMNEAAGELKPGKWQSALAPEQRALQSLLRAEAMFRDIQVAFGQSGRGGASGGAGRDLERLFDLELDTTKNQYETGESSASPSAEQKALDEALQRLQMLANRQQELGAQRMQQQQFEQRWQEEQLRREAEQLRQQMEQIAQNALNGARGQQTKADGNALSEAIRRLERAENEMRKAVSERDASAQQRALEELRDAEKLLSDLQRQNATNSIQDLAEQARQIAEAQKDIGNRVKQTYGSASGRREASPNQMPEMDDPRFGVRYGRQFWQQFDAAPPRSATPEEKALAEQKEKLAQQLEQLEREIERQAESMAGEQPTAASKLRDALSEAQQKELALRMKKSAEWIRDGFGSRSSGLEDSVSRGVEQLSRNLNDAQKAFKADDEAGQDRDEQAKALGQLRALREQLERGADTKAGGGPGIASHPDVREALNQLSALRQRLDRSDRQLRDDVDDALRSLNRLYGAKPGLLESRISDEILPTLERLEMDLSRRLGKRDENARTAASEPAPEGYGDAVAEYFRRLSR